MCICSPYDMSCNNENYIMPIKGRCFSLVWCMESFVFVFFDDIIKRVSVQTTMFLGIILKVLVFVGSEDTYSTFK